MAADLYVRSVGGGSGAWATAYTTMAAAIAAAVAGDNFWVADDHNESTAGAVTLTFPGTHALPCRVWTVNHAGSQPPVAADVVDVAGGAAWSVIATSGANAMIVTGVAFIHGVAFIAGSGAVSATLTLGSAIAFGLTLKDCKLAIGNTATNAAAMVWGAAPNFACYIVLLNPTISFAGTGQSIRVNSTRTYWRGGQLIGSVPTTLFGTSNLRCWCTVDGADLSTVAGTLVAAVANSEGNVVFKNCKLHPSLATVSAAQTTGPGSETYLVNSGAAAGSRNEKHNYCGDLTTDLAVYRSGGATDNVAPYGFKVIPTSHANEIYPFEFVIPVWNDTIAGSITLSVFGGYSVGVPYNDDIWLEAGLMVDSTDPKVTYSTNGRANSLTTHTQHSSDASTWNSSPGTKFVMTKTVTAPAQKGLIFVFVKIAAATGTFYIDPKVVVS